jgi:hypothetical protein
MTDTIPMFPETYGAAKAAVAESKTTANTTTTFLNIKPPTVRSNPQPWNIPEVSWCELK